MTVDPGRARDVIIEGCGTESLAVAGPQSHAVLGCLDEPGDELGVSDSAIDRRVMKRHECVGTGGLPFEIQVYDPNK